MFDQTHLFKTPARRPHGSKSQVSFRVRASNRKPEAPTRLEPLEPRLLMSTIVVNSPLDTTDPLDVVTTLREAIQVANDTAGADQIAFDDSIFNSGAFDRIALTLGTLPQVTDALSIDGSIDGGTARLTLDGAHRGAILQVRSAQLDIMDLDLTNGRAPAAGAGTNALSGGFWTGWGTNYGYVGVAAGVAGGAVRAQDAQVTVTHSTLSNSAAGWGGAIAALGGSLTLTDVTIQSCLAAPGEAAVFESWPGGDGMIDAFVPNVGVIGALGGGRGGALALYQTVTNIRQSTLTSNVATNGGGAIFALGGSLTLSDAMIEGNSAVGGDAYARVRTLLEKGENAFIPYLVPAVDAEYDADAPVTGFGGGLYGLSTALAISNSTFSDNVALYGGAIYGGGTIDNSTIAFNTALGAGGVFASDTLTLRSSTISNSTASVSDVDRASDSVINADRSLIENTAPAAINGTNSSNIFDQDPMLAPLADNGGPTHALMEGSPAINAGANPLNLVYDQRGPDFPRVVGAAPDIGAYESPFDPAPPPPPAGITLSPTSGLTTSEDGASATFTVALDSQPTADVTINVSSGDTTEGAVNTSAMTFTPSNWNIAQTVTVTGVNDDVDDGDVAYMIVTAPASSADPGYSGLDAADVSAVNTDNDTAGFTVSPISGLTTTEAGGTASFTVKLNSQPTANVTINVSSSDTTEGTANVSALTFTPVNWNTLQTVTVRGVDDTVRDGDIAYTIVLAAATSADPGYNGLNPADVSVVNKDNEKGGGGGGKSAKSAKSRSLSDSATDETTRKGKKRKGGRKAERVSATDFSGPKSAEQQSQPAPSGSASSAAIVTPTISPLLPDLDDGIDLLALSPTLEVNLQWARAGLAA